jgi:hypothetical protein
MTAPTLDLTQFSDKKVTVTFRADGSGEPTTKEGLVQAASAAGILFKEKGKADIHIIEPGWIDSIDMAPEKEPKVTTKKLQPVPEGRVRQHLADRHGYLVDDLNKMTEAQATELHDGIDHNGLGHIHETPKAQQEAAGSPEPDISDISDIEGIGPEDDDETDEDPDAETVVDV